MTLPTDYVDGDVLTAADVNAITTAVNGISPVIQSYKYVRNTTSYTTTSTAMTNSGVSLSYTPVNASNNLVIEATFGSRMFGSHNMNLSIKQIEYEIYDSTAAAIIAEARISYDTEVNTDDPTGLNTIVCMRNTTSANSTSARTYVIRFKTINAVLTNAFGNTILSVTEVKP